MASADAARPEAGTDETWQYGQEPGAGAAPALAAGEAAVAPPTASAAASGPPGTCTKCGGEGVIQVPYTRPCKNCNGVGYCAAERGNRFVCSICNGEGRDTVTNPVSCQACGGTGRPGAVASKGSAGADVEAGGAVRKGDSMEGVRWQAQQGLVIDLTLNTTCLLSTTGLLVVVLGFAFLLAKVAHLGMLIVLGGAAVLLVAAFRRMQAGWARAAQAARAAEAGAAPEAPRGSGLEGTERLTCDQCICIVTLTLIPNLVLVYFFSDMGIGTEVYSAVSPWVLNLLGDLVVSLGSLIFGVLVVFDWFFWRRVLIKVVAAAVPISLIAIGVILKGRKYSWGPILMCVSLIPLSLGVLRITLCRYVRRQSFYKAVTATTGCCALLALFSWCCWIALGSHEWDTLTRMRLIDETSGVYKHVYSEMPLDYATHCGPNKDLSEFEALTRSHIGAACATAATITFMAYSCPFIAFLCNAVIAVFCFLEGVTVDLRDMPRAQKVLKQFVLTVCLVVAGVYASTNISSASFRLGSTLMAFLGAAFVMLLGWMYMEIGQHRISTLVAQNDEFSRLFQFLHDFWTSDWSRAILVGTFNVVIPIGLFLNMITMKVRRWRGTTDSTDRYTPSGTKVYEEMCSWNWVSIFTKVCLLAELFFMLQVGVAKITNIFLSWLNTLLSPLDFFVVIILVMLVGYCMFLLPPVPGVPVYVFAGIVIAEQGKSTSIGYAGGIIVAVIVCFCLKLVACASQYGIGYFLGKSVQIQKLIGVDQVGTRAVEQILKERGLTFGKVAVLVGGPDWPTSVTCGILQMNVPQMLLGTCPVILVVGPCVLTGAFLAQVTSGEESVWNVLADTALGCAVMVNCGSTLWAVYETLNVIQRDGPALTKHRPEHDAVAELTRQGEREARIYKQVASWNALDRTWQGVLLAAIGCLLSSCFVFVMFAEACFRDFSVSSKIGEDLPDGLGGNWLNIVRGPMGWFPIGIFFLGVALHIVFTRRMSSVTKKLLKDPEAGKEPAAGAEVRDSPSLAAPVEAPIPAPPTDTLPPRDSPAGPFADAAEEPAGPFAAAADDPAGPFAGAEAEESAGGGIASL